MSRSSTRRSLAVARLVGATALALVAQIAVDMPDGYFGRQDTITAFGAAYALTTLAAAGLAILAVGRRSRAASRWLAVLYSLHIGLFVPALAADPLVAGPVVLWNLLLLSQQLLPRRRPVAEPVAGSDALDPWMAQHEGGMRHLLRVSLALALAVVGYRLTDQVLALAACLALGHGAVVYGWRFLLHRLRGGRRLPLLVLAAQLASLATSGRPLVALGLLALAQGLLLSLLLARQRSTRELLHYFFTHPSRLIVLTFAGAILAGAVLLTFPAASAHDPVAPIDALFTATSATCVTGLVVLDTGSHFSTLGQITILVLIQVGGLGIMTLSTFGALLIGGTLGLRGEHALAEILDRPTPSDALRLTRFIVLSTLGIEAVGAVGLTACFAAAGLGWPEAAWRGVFHAVSAFCNAGFALQEDSLVMFREQPFALLLVALLIVLGGTGFVVLAAVADRLREPRRLLALQARLVVTATAVLLVAGTLIYALAEWERSLAGLPAGAKLVNAFFQSATLRTAGFNSVGLSTLAPATIFFMMTFMFIGAAPGSTAGGIKTTTAAVLLASIRAAVRGLGSVVLFRREVPSDVVLRSLVIFAVSAMILGGGFFLLLLFEDQPFSHLLFEAVSAFGTVGLSLGATAGLSPVGKLLVSALMLAGRIGPLTVALLLGSAGRDATRHGYPAARIMVG